MPALSIKDQKGRTRWVSLEPRGYVLGRERSCEIVLDDMEASRRHAEIGHADGRYFVQDLGSTNRTFVNGNPVSRAELSDWDQIRIGSHILVFRESGLSAEESLQFSTDTICFLQPSKARTIEEASAAELLMVERVNKKIASMPSLEAMLEFIFSETRPVFLHDRISVAFVEEEGRRLRAYYVAANYPTLKLEKNYTRDLPGSSLQAVIEQGSPRIIGDLTAYLREHPDSASTRLIVEEGIRSNLTCPLVVDGRNVGLLFHSSRLPLAFTEHHIGLHQAMVEHLSSAVEKAYRIEQLRAAHEAYFGMLGFVVHELKSPIASVVMLARTMAGGYLGDLPPKQREVLERMIAKCGYLLDLVSEYLNLARLEGGELKGRFQPVTDLVAQVVEPSVEVVREQIENKKMRLLRLLPEAAVDGEFDPDLLKIVLTNFLGNAAKYGFAGGEIRLRVTADSTAVQVAVKNEGPGFPESERHRLFRKFSRLQTPALMKEKGSGVGLYTSWRIAQLHGGRIEADAEEGRWAEFSLLIPRRQPRDTNGEWRLSHG